ncbi:MAG TPA: DUF5683 domain-containing protein [Cyclobacteriaceae bacterium]|nr:DUF5683 domain-containing protein [Cyclobacteriaceae bacterium]
MDNRVIIAMGLSTKAFPILLLVCLSYGTGYSQIQADTVPAAVELDAENIVLTPSEAKDPKVATILSAVFPGAGQAYNEKIWKIPIIYGGIITTAYFVEFNNRRYRRFKEALTIVRSPGGTNPFPNLNEDGIIRNVDYWRRNRDLCYLIFGVIYVLGIVDAQVDAHLSGFDVSDDLSLKLEPAYESLSAGGKTIGLSMKINF